MITVDELYKLFKKSTGISTDSRTAQEGAMFFALKGEKFDGNDYAVKALENGAKYAIVDRATLDGTSVRGKRYCILVENVLKTMQQLASYHRRQFDIPVIGITGTNGKTTTKELVSAVLSKKYNIVATKDNINNQIGVPMTVSRIEPEHEAAVVEMGISGFGEMTALARIARPTLAVFTVIGHAHLEFLNDLDGVFRAKTEMLAFLPEDGTVIVNGDDPYLRALRCPQRKICVGFGEDNDLRAEDIRLEGEAGMACTVACGARRFPVRITAFGRHLIYAALEGAAVGMVLGLTDEEIAEGLTRFQAVGHRSAVIDTGRLTLIDDCYNANPDSVRSGLDSLSELPGRHVAILGDMLEMGENGPALHRDIGRYCREKGVDLLLASGPLARYYVEGAGDVGRLFASREALIEALPQLLRQGDAVLVKASLGMGFLAVAEAVRQL